MVKLLLDSQQRTTSVDDLLRGKSPKFFDGDAQAFTGLRCHLRVEVVAFYQPLKMMGDPLWMGVTNLLGMGSAGLGQLAAAFGQLPELAMRFTAAAASPTQQLPARSSSSAATADPG